MSGSSPLIPVAEAFRLFQASCPKWGEESLPLPMARGGVLVQDLRAQEDWPPFPRVMMDGVALDSTSPAWRGAWLPVQGVQAAGDPPLVLAASHMAIEVMTGAFLPQGCDCVVPVEDLELTRDAVRLRPEALARPGLHVHARGSDARHGDLLLPRGTLLHGPALAVAAAAGASQVLVGRKPRVVILATGKELVPMEATPLPWQIRASNGPALVASMEHAGFPVQGQALLDDNPDTLRQAISQALDEADVLVLSGAVSKGRFDHVPALLKDAGCRILFHGVAQRPGKPLLAALREGGRPTLVMGLPGNPVSALCTLHRYLLPVLEQQLGLPAREAPVRVASDHPRHPRFTLFLPARLVVDETGCRHAQLLPTSNSGDFAPLAGTQGFVEIEPGPPPPPEGRVASFHPWS